MSANTGTVRLVGWVVKPVLMLDDGDDLTPMNCTEQMIPRAQWQAFKDGGDEAAVGQIRAQALPEPTSTPPSNL